LFQESKESLVILNDISILIDYSSEHYSIENNRKENSKTLIGSMDFQVKFHEIRKVQTMNGRETKKVEPAILNYVNGFHILI